jgi:hypothetical protein
MYAGLLWNAFQQSHLHHIEENFRVTATLTWFMELVPLTLSSPVMPRGVVLFMSLICMSFAH